MSEREMVPWKELIQQWEGETPLLLTDQVLGQLLDYADRSEAKSERQEKLIQELALSLAEVRARVKVFMEGGGKA